MCRVVIALLLALAVFPFAACSRKKDASPRTESSKPATRGSTPTEIQPYLAEGDANTKAGQIIYLNHVKLEPGPIDSGVYAVGPDGQKMFVVMKDPPKVAPDPGKRFDVQGSVERTPASATMRKKWKMKKDEAEQVQKIGVYVEGESISASAQ